MFFFLLSGTKELRRGETTFFLQPGESLASGIQEMHVLADDEALLLQVGWGNGL